MKNFKRIHFIGIGGVGMSALAWVFARQGYIVSGSDIAANSLTARLQNAGVTIYIGHRAENVAGADLVVISSAIKPDNPELHYAMKHKLPVWHRAKLLGYLLNNKRGITVSGTHGKTTTTSMISLILRETGLDPTILIGGEVNDVGGNAVFGEGEFVVAEADESDGSFLHLKPEIAVITNIEEEHRDFYKDLKHELEFFIQFISNVKENGVVVVCLEDYGACQIIDKVNRRFFTYAIGDPAADLNATECQLYPWGSEYSCLYKDNLLGSVRLSVPGEHNISNSLAALSVGLILGLPFEKMADILANFHGAARRFQLKGHTAGITVIDDYA
ncbi:MAG: UDP-N-acetylmuramate--L-alanine ligase, partial [Candidatus Sumerlaeia bacterium]|nr:UDP-N-acetylmuramate--L-alanine ligase [Candidatus Sumerlaeia bacterium]